MENSILQLFPSGSRALWQSVAEEQASIQTVPESGGGASGHRTGALGDAGAYLPLFPLCL